MKIKNCDRVLRKRFGNINYVDFSDLGSYYSKNVFRDFSIKYVFWGTEHYKTDGGTFDIKANELLFSNCQNGEVYIDGNSERTVGLCIFLKTELLPEALKINAFDCLHTDPETNAEQFSQFPYFLEGMVSQKNGRVKAALNNLCTRIEDGENLDDLVDYEWLLSLAGAIVKEEGKNFKMFVSLGAKKNSTKKELLKRLFLGKEFMDDVFLKNPSIPEIARVSMLSEYHFYRSFKTAFGISPYQYLLEKRLEFARELILNKNVAVYQAASAIGFSDPFSFSKAFKQKYNVAPGVFLKRAKNDQSSVYS